MMKLIQLDTISGRIELLTGLHIGSGNTEMHIGGTDNPVIKNPITQQPYIPGSSIKGKMRSLLEWQLGVVGITDGSPLGFGHMKDLPEADLEAAKDILKLFGGAPGEGDESLVREIGPTRLSFWDCNSNPDWIKEMDERTLLYTETKMENSIDRIKGVAENPRNTERVPAGAVFDFQVTLRVHGDEDLLDTLLKGLRLLELTGLGGSGSRGYGKLHFTELKRGEEDLLPKMQAIKLEQAA